MEALESRLEALVHREVGLLHRELGLVRGEIGQVRADMAKQTRLYVYATLGAVATVPGLAFAGLGG